MASLLRALVGMSVFALIVSVWQPSVAQSEPSAPGSGFEKRNFFGEAKDRYADVVTVSGPAKTIYMSGTTGFKHDAAGAIQNYGDAYSQCLVSYEKIKQRLATQGATMDDIVKTVAYVTDVRYRADYMRCRKDALGGAQLAAHTFIVVSALAAPGLVVEVDVTAAVSR